MSKRRKKNSYPEEAESVWSLNPETKGAIFTVLVFVLAFLSILAMFDLAGAFGRLLNFALAYAFGWANWLFIILLLFCGYVLIRSGYRIKGVTYAGLAAILISVSGLLNFFVREFTFSEISQSGRGGGALGYGIGFGLDKLLGFWGSLVVFGALFLIGIFLAFNTSFKGMSDKAKSLGILKEKILPLDDYPEESEEDTKGFEPELLEEDVPFVKEAAIAKIDDKDEVADLEVGEKIPVRRVPRKIIVPLELLERSNSKPDSGDINANMNKIQKTFENFGIDVTMGEVNVGPTVTQYTLRPAEGVRLAQMLTLQNDLALSLAAHPLRMEAPIPGKSLVGIEVPNQTVSMVKLRDILDSSAYTKRKNNLYIALGKDVTGKANLANLADMPHLLIAGATGSGKSVCVNNIILSLIYENSPDELKFILIDPKRVELSAYNGIPHLLTPVINDTDKIINALRWVVKEMHERYKLLQASGKRNIDSYNKAVIVNRLPYIIVVVDEFAALMSLASKEVEAAIVSLAQMARAVGIHLVLATQRPSVDVITGLIKANITSRIAFAVASSMDSRTIIDTSGAEKLLGKGDMLFMTSEESKPRRIQGAYVSDEEIAAVVSFIKDKAEPEYNDAITEKTSSGPVAGFGGEKFEDELALEAKDIVLKAGKASATLLQRRLRIGYARAARLLDILEEMGIVGQAEGSKPREVLISREDLEENFSSALDETEVDDIENSVSVAEEDFDSDEAAADEEDEHRY